jgi:hypothetical protein
MPTRRSARSPERFRGRDHRTVRGTVRQGLQRSPPGAHADDLRAEAR